MKKVCDPEDSTSENFVRDTRSLFYAIVWYDVHKMPKNGYNGFN